MSTRRSIEKKRMKFAFEFVNGKSFGKDDAKTFESYVHKVPAYILTNGLGNTFAFLATKGDAQWKNVQDAICKWLGNVENPIMDKLQGKQTFKDILQVMTDDDFSIGENRAVTTEVLTLLNWLRRFAKAKRLELK